LLQFLESCSADGGQLVVRHFDGQVLIRWDRPPAPEVREGFRKSFWEYFANSQNCAIPTIDASIEGIVKDDWQMESTRDFWRGPASMSVYFYVASTKG